jgi:hypothetical protein
MPDIMQVMSFLRSGCRHGNTRRFCGICSASEKTEDFQEHFRNGTEEASTNVTPQNP